MKRRALLAGIAAGFALSAPVRGVAKPLSLAEITNYLRGLTTARGRFTQTNADGTRSRGTFYLRGLTTARGRFTQTNADGTRSRGTFYLHRPGRMRFEYDAPDPALVVAGGGALAIFDKKSNTGPQVYPLSETPLNVFLSRGIDLRRSPMIVGHDPGEEETAVIAQDPEHPEYGRIRLVFGADPVRLLRWVIADQSGRQTVIELGEMVEGEALSSFLFNRVYIEERLLRGAN